MARPAVVRVPQSLYFVELVVIHCAAHELRTHLMTLPPEIPAACDDDDDPGLGFGHIVSAPKPMGLVRRYAVLYVDIDQTAREKRLTIVHEAGHLAVRLFDAIGQDVTGAVDEPFGYLLEWITREAWAACAV